MTDRVRVGVIGTSGWADFMYLSTLYHYPGADLVALCGRNRKRAEELAAKYKIPKVYTDYRAMICPGNLDAIIVGSPDDLHYEMAMLAVHSGCHVLCDKPLALTAQQALEMYETAEQAGVKHMVLFTFRWMPFFRYVRDLIDQGIIGSPYQCEFRFLMGYARKKEYLWRLDRNRANGALGDLGVHMIDLARWLVGDIVRVSAHSAVFVDRLGADGGQIDPANDSAFLLTEFANGAHGMIHASLVTHLADRYMQQQVRLYGEGGSLEIDIQYEGTEAGVVLQASRYPEVRFERLEVPASYWGTVKSTEPFATFTQQSVGCRALIDAILQDRPITPTFFDGYKAQRVIASALEAHQTGRWVDC